jgi:hypothetical protein
MARLRRGAKTQAVRDYLAEHPESNPQAVVDGLKASGMKVKITLVRSILYKKPSKPGWRKRAPVVQAAARRTSKTSVTVERLLEIKRFADSIGGPDQLRQALDMLAQLQ